MNAPAFRRTLLAIALAGFATTTAAQDTTTVTQSLEKQIDTLSQQLEAMKAQLQQLKAQNDALAAQQQQQAQAQAQQAQLQQAQAKAQEAQARQIAQAALPSRASLFDNLSLWGYGEIYYTRPIHQPSLTQADLARAVFGIGYRFDDSTRFNSEYEIEHAVSSSGDVGEFEVEQFYVDHTINKYASVEGGLFLMPVGLLNEHHEPTAYYGVQRNFVETLIIPSTWREGGLAFHGDTDFGLGWNLGMTTGLDLSKWEFNPEDPQYRTALDLENSGVAPMQATHQELSLANGEHLSQYLSLSYRGVPGLELGAFGSTGEASVPQKPEGLPDQRVTLWEAHARWMPGRADLSALYTRGIISNTGPDNLANAGVSNPMPASFYGYFAQAAYTVWENSTYKLSPFLRWERYNIGASYEGIPEGYTAVPTGLTSTGGRWPLQSDRVWTYGANFYVTPNVVLKADYQSFQNNSDFTRFDLGLGLNF